MLHEIETRLGQRVEDDDGLVGAGDDGLGDSDQFVLLAEDAEARDGPGIAIKLRGRAGGQFGAAGLDLGH